jgi:SanA protein
MRMLREAIRSGVGAVRNGVIYVARRAWRLITSIRLKRLIWIGCAATLSGGAVILFSEWLVGSAAEGKLYDSVSDIPVRQTGVVLGTSKFVASGGVNAHYKNRIDAAVELYEASKVTYILVTGDNGEAEYDEPTTMKSDLVSRGIPAENIYRDFAGFRTFDSMVRAKKVFGLDSFTVISERFHNERAIYISEHESLAVIGFNAKDVDAYYGLRTQIRERFARLAAVLDVTLFDTQPKFLGEKIEIGKDAAN